MTTDTQAEVRPHRTRHSFIAVLAAVLAVGGCSGTGAGGCGGMGPIPTGRYAGPKSDNAVNIRLSPNGINYLNSNWQTLVELFAPGRSLNLPFNCIKQTVAVLGDVYVADQGNAAGTGRLDGICNATDLPANVRVTVTGFTLVPQPTDRLQATVQLNIDTGKIYLTNPHTLCDLRCSIRFNSAAVTPPDNRVTATVQFTIDQKWDKLLAFNVQSVGGTQICGSSNAQPKPACLDALDLALNSEGGFCSYACDAADWDPIKVFVLQLVSPMLQDQISSAVAAQSCEACGTGLPSCPRLPAGCTGGACTATSTCTNGVCMDGATNKCVPRFLGMEGRMGFGALLGTFGAPPDAEMDLSVAAGSSVSVDQGLSMGSRGGTQAVKVAPCVTPQAAPPMVAVNPPDFDGEATPGSGYHVGLSASTAFLNQTFHNTHQSGALCLQMTTATVGLINTGLFKTFLPSLGRLTTRDGKDAPMMVALRPARPPVVTVGQGTFDPVTKKPIKPLMTVTLPEVSIDFYAMLDDRYARLFTLTADITLPLSLIFEGCDKVTPAIGDLKQLITNIRTANSEMLAEDPAVLADLVPAVIGLAEPAVASGLSGFALPQLGSFKLKVNEAKGLGNIAGTETYNHLGIYATLMDANAACAVLAPKTVVSLKRSVMPAAQDMRLRGQKLPWPEAVLDVRALGKAGTPEFAVKVDEGLWTTFYPAPNGEFVVSDPAFLLQGLHTLHVRSRVAEDPHGISMPATVGFLVDWEPPELSFTADVAADRLVLSARDVVTAPDKLTYAYRVGQGAFSDFGPAREISLSAVEGQGGVTARVKDELGNIAELSWRAPTVALRTDAVDVFEGPATQAGCTAVGGLELLALAALGLLRRSRR